MLNDISDDYKYITVVYVNPVVSLGLHACEALTLLKWLNGLDLYDCGKNVGNSTLWFQRFLSNCESLIDDFDYSSEECKLRILTMLDGVELVDLLSYGKIYIHERYVRVTPDNHLFGDYAKYADGATVFRTSERFENNGSLEVII